MAIEWVKLAHHLLISIPLGFSLIFLMNLYFSFLKSLSLHGHDFPPHSHILVRIPPFFDIFTCTKCWRNRWIWLKPPRKYSRTGDICSIPSSRYMSLSSPLTSPNSEIGTSLWQTWQWTILHLQMNLPFKCPLNSKCCHIFQKSFSHSFFHSFFHFSFILDRICYASGCRHRRGLGAVAWPRSMKASFSRATKSWIFLGLDPVARPVARPAVFFPERTEEQS